jgi:hypothetical protein
MPATLQSVTLRIKNDEGSYSTNSIAPNVTDDNLVRFAAAYNSLQSKEAEGFFKKTTHLMTV